MTSAELFAEADDLLDAPVCEQPAPPMTFADDDRDYEAEEAADAAAKAAEAARAKERAKERWRILADAMRDVLADLREDPDSDETRAVATMLLDEYTLARRFFEEMSCDDTVAALKKLVGDFKLDKSRYPMFLPHVPVFVGVPGRPTTKADFAFAVATHVLQRLYTPVSPTASVENALELRAALMSLDGEHQGSELGYFDGYHHPVYDDIADAFHATKIAVDIADTYDVRDIELLTQISVMMVDANIHGYAHTHPMYEPAELLFHGIKARDDVVGAVFIVEDCLHPKFRPLRVHFSESNPCIQGWIEDAVYERMSRIAEIVKDVPANKHGFVVACVYARYDATCNRTEFDVSVSRVPGVREPFDATLADPEDSDALTSSFVRTMESEFGHGALENPPHNPLHIASCAVFLWRGNYRPYDCSEDDDDYAVTDASE